MRFRSSQIASGLFNELGLKDVRKRRPLEAQQSGMLVFHQPRQRSQSLC